MKQEAFTNENFKNINYSGQKITNSEFIDCTFEHCDFSNSILLENDFIDCCFESCNFAMAKLSGSGLKTVEFKDCKLMGINFDHCADFLFEVNFHKCILDYSSFVGKRMKKAKFTDCSLTEVDFTGVDLTNAVFARCDLLRTVFNRSNLERVDFRTASNYMFDPELNKLKKARFSLSGVPGLLGKYNIEIE